MGDKTNPESNRKTDDEKVHEAADEHAFTAATRGTENAKPQHPAHVESGQERTGRHADESWKKHENSTRSEASESESRDVEGP
jgi:hypothetical protein